MLAIVPSIAFSLFLVFVVFGIGRTGRSAGWTCLAAFVSVPLSMMGLHSLVACLHALGTLAVALVCAASGVGHRPIFWGSIGVMAASYWLVLPTSLTVLHEVQTLRRKHPLVSIDHRLAYEDAAVKARPAAPPELAAHVEQRLVRFELSQYSNRKSLLSQLHDDTRDRFIASSGFGVARLLSSRRETLQFPDEPPVPQPSPYDAPIAPDQPGKLLQDRLVARPARNLLLGLHNQGLHDFLNAERMGYVRQRRIVAGFEPHAFTAVPAFSVPQTSGKPWRVVRLELVSLLKHETPRVYVSEHLPRMDELQDAVTRPLDAFERRALNKLYTEEDLIIDDGPTHLRMLGALRAASSCLDCHNTHRGALLGAFSYELVPEGTLPPPRPEAPPPKV